MSWFARSIANTLLSADDRDTDGEDPRPSASYSPGSPPRGVREDLSELTDALANRFQGFASFLAAPTPGGSDGSRRAPNPAEIAGRFRAGLARLPGRQAVADLAKIASSLLPPEEDWSGEEAAGVTEDVVVFARDAAMRPELWLDFPFLPDDADSDDFDMTDAQQDHALAVESVAPELADLRIELCPGHISEGCFWKIYFVLLHPKLTKEEADLLSTPQMEPYVQTETYDLENGGSLVFERDLYLVSERLERPPPKFHGVRIHDTPTGEQQWMITADLKGSSEPPISERILFSFKACNWPDGLAHALQEGLARVCGQHIAALRGSRFAYFARHDTMGEPMAPSSHPVLMIHVQHLDLMLHETRKDLERTRVYNHRAQMTVAHHAEAIQMLAKDRKILRLQRAKKDATIRRLREKIRTLEVTVRTQQDQIQEMEEEGDDIQGGDDFLSDDNDFEDDEFTDEEDYEFLEAAEDGIIPIDVDEDDE